MRVRGFGIGVLLLLLAAFLAVFGTVMADGERSMRSGALLIAAVPLIIGFAMIGFSIAAERRDVAMRKALQEDR